MTQFFTPAALPLNSQMASIFTENLVGRVLDQRYALTELVGVGGSARVYRAEDRRLKRFVAVKVLHSSFSEDSEFVHRFRQEAESLAHLSHPNIVVVYDVNDGENATGEPPFLVTEYLSGGTLRSVLDDGNRLSPSQTARVGLDAARGLAFAHARDLVHRDIKPANLIFGDDTRIRIADFGLARALADFSRTEQRGIPVGSARYMSPEQARGAAVDGRSDVYSLALVLIECLTGSVPFVTDTLAGTTVARLNSGISAPFEAGPLGAIIEAAGTLDPRSRLDATALVAELETVAKTLPRADPIPLDGSRLASKSVLVDQDPTRHLSKATDAPNELIVNGTVPVDDSKANEQAKKTGLYDIDLDDTTSAGRQSDSAKSAPPGLTGASAAGLTATTSVASDLGKNATTGTSSKADKRAEKKLAKANKNGLTTGDAAEKSKRSRKVAFAVLSALTAGAAAAGTFAVVKSNKVASHPVPNFEHKNLPQAKAAAAPLKFEVHVADSQFDPMVPLGQVISQYPESGTALEEKKTIELTISKGIAPIDVPDLSGLTIDAATGALRALKLKVADPAVTQDSETIEAGKVISWSPTGSVAPGTAIAVVVSAGPPTVEIPKLVGLRESAAVEAVAAVNAAAAESTPTASTSTTTSSTPTQETASSGLATSTSTAETAAADTQSDSTPSTDPGPSSQPGGSVALLAKFVRVANDATKGTVYATDPPAGTIVAKGSGLTVYVSSGPAYAIVPDVVNLTPANASASIRAAGFRVGNTIGPADQPVLHTRPLRRTRQRRGTTVTLYTTDAGVPVVPGVPETQTTIKGTQAPAPGGTPVSGAPGTVGETTVTPTSKPATKPSSSKPSAAKPTAPKPSTSKTK